MNLLFDFQVDKAKKLVTIIREFEADQSLVWDAFTKAELLDQWVAPKPLTAKTKFADFKEGGQRLYAMIMPDGNERWAIQTYRTITPKTHFTMHNAFSDKDGNPDMHGSEWDYRFSGENGRTTVTITIYNESLERMEAILDGFTVGMRMSLENLDELLGNLS